MDDYFNQCWHNENYKKVLDRYNGRFYYNELRTLYYQKIESANLHILIISGLFGVLRYDDLIPDYHLEITKPDNQWKLVPNPICDAVKWYINQNNIDDNLVFYSLSNPYKKALSPIPEWQNLWVTGARSANLANSANFLRDKFLPLL